MVALSLLLEQDELDLRAVALSRAEAEVRWVATSELDDPAPFLEGGELLLTTGLVTKGWRGQWDDYVKRLVDARVAALGLGTGLTHARPPKALVTACERHGLNLLDVPRATPFVSVSRVAARLIGGREEAQARAALDMQRQLSTAAAQPEARDAVVAKLGALLDGAATLLAADGRRLHGPVGPRRELVDLELVAEELARIRPMGLRAAANISTAASTTFVVPVGLAGRPSQYLSATVAGRLGGAERSAVTTAVSLLGLVAEQDRNRVDARRRLVGKALALLADGETDTARLVVAAADATGPPERIQVLSATGAESRLEDALVSSEDAGLLAAIVDGQLVAAGAPRSISRFASELAELHVGVGEPVRLDDSANALRTAALALAQTTDAQPLVHWVELVRGGVLALVDQPLATAFAESFLGALDDSELETLESFLRHHGSRLQVSEALGIHRNTVRNRLAVIEDKLSRSLDDPATRVAAWVALQVRS